MRRAIAVALVVSMSILGLAGVAAAAEGGGGKPTHEGEECIKILEGGGDVEDCQEAPNPILPEPNEIIYGTIAFFLLLLLLAKYAYPAIEKGMHARSERIRENLDEADRVRGEAAGVLAEYQRQLADARNESNRIVEEARQTAEQLRRDLMQRAEAEVAELRQRSRDDIVAAQERAMSELQGRVGALAVELAEKVVEANLDRDANLRLVERYIEQVGAQR